MAVQVTVTFDANGGDSVSPLFAVHVLPDYYGSLATALRDGYVFDGWWTAADGGAGVAADTLITVEANHTLYAHWSEPEPEAAPLFEITDDGEWVYFKASVVAGNLPAGLQAAYDAWLTYGERFARLSLLVSGVSQDFRKAVDAETHSVGGTDVTLLPLPCQRHAQLMVWYFLGLDAGYADVADLRTGWQDAEVYLRSLYMATKQGANRFAENGGGTPRYSAGGSDSGAGAPGGYIAVDGREGGTASYGGGVINLGL